MVKNISKGKKIRASVTESPYLGCQKNLTLDSKNNF